MIRFDDIVYRPIDVWPGDNTKERRRAMFSAPWLHTQRLLERELAELGAKKAVLQIALEERDFRIDGRPRAQARASHPGVILAFDSKHGPLKYAVDTFTKFDDNVRAIALGLEALRKVDRYGMTTRGEQYTGFRALPQSTTTYFYTREDAQAFLEEHGGYRDAARRFHPDNPDTGDPELMTKLNAAKELVA